MTQRIAIYDPDEKYRERLAETLCHMDPNEFQAFAVDSPKTLFRSDADVLLFGGDEADAEEVARGQTVVFLSESVGYDREGGVRRVCKFRPVEQIIRAIRPDPSEQREAQAPGTDGTDVAVYGVQSPLGRSGKTSLALALGFALSETGKTLFAGLDCFSGWDGNSAGPEGFSLSDLLYLENAGMSETPVPIRKNRLDILLPPAMAEDLYRTPDTEIHDSLMRFAVRSGYRSLVLDLGASYGVAEAFRAEFRNLFVPTLPGEEAAKKVQAYLNWFFRIAPQAKDCIKTVRVPMPPGSREGAAGFSESIMLTEIGTEARAFIRTK